MTFRKTWDWRKNTTRIRVEKLRGWIAEGIVIAGLAMWIVLLVILVCIEPIIGVACMIAVGGLAPCMLSSRISNEIENNGYR